MTSRAYIFTLNNPTLPITFGEDVKYGIWQLERAPSTGTEHLQGYLELTKAVRISYMQQLLPGAHFEKRRGTRDQARNYSSKEETRISGPWEHGIWTAGQGRRSDLEELHELLRNGTTERNIRDEHFNLWARHYRTIERYKLLDNTQKRNFKTEVYVLIGNPGTGKSNWCRETSKEAYWKQNSKWWCGYDGTSDVIIDDFYGWIPWSTLLNICDKYPCTVETKGGQVNFAPKRLFITSNTHWMSWYTNEKINTNAFHRRINFIVEIDNYIPLINKLNDYAHAPSNIIIQTST